MVESAVNLLDVDSHCFVCYNCRVWVPHQVMVWVLWTVHAHGVAARWITLLHTQRVCKGANSAVAAARTASWPVVANRQDR